MKKIICFLVLLAFVPGLHADNKKKKSQQQQSSGGGHPQTPGGGGGGGPHLPGLSHGPSQSGAAAASHRPNLGRPSSSGMSSSGGSHSGMSANNPLSRHSAAAPGGSSSGASSGMSSNNPLNRHATTGAASGRGSNQSAMSANNPLNRGANSATGGTQANMAAGGANNNANSNNPMMRRAGGAGANPANQGAQMNNQAAARGGNPAGQRNAFSGNNNGMGRGGAQAAMHDRNPNAFRGPNRNPNAHWAAEHGRGANARYGAHGWAHPARANYHVRGYREVFHGYHRAWHDRGWYAARYDRVVVFGGGYYYWDGGYWYPAWGYDPAFSVYVYDGPIYSYANLPPDQVIVNVQTELQDQGYYIGEIDGQLGPQTRDALGAYQADHNLEVTAAIDEPTVEALGLT